jgi:hypothetical protein
VDSQTVAFERPGSPLDGRPGGALRQSLDRIAVDMPFDGKRMIYGGFTPIVDA